ncbi:aldo/keto reductase [Megasphaera elsdenii]|uniref:aldo/keto reductase n=1 Tax=Megasphaera elsdenii TaxID=907 RepID=UPI0022DEE2C9|nr:aldo/keto reductase [Megasphaera elsdenii]
MKMRRLRDLEVSAIGMGCMGFTHAYGDIPEEKDGIRAVHKAFELGCNFFDTAEMYSYFKNEEFVGKALKELPRDKVIISDKFWPTPLPGQDMPEGKLSEAGIRKDIEGSLKRLQTDYIDLYTEHQMEEGSEEEVAEVMGKLIKEGKIRAWGQASPTLEQIKKANAVTPITAIQSEYSMMERKWEKDVLPYCREQGIGFVAFSPMANGFLSGKFSAKDTFQKNDLRTVITRFNKENMEANEPLLELVRKFASAKNCTPAQIGLAWVMAYGDFVVPIPGMRKEERIIENLGAADIELTAEEYAALNDELAKIKIHGTRDNKDIAKLGTVPENTGR